MKHDPHDPGGEYFVEHGTGCECGHPYCGGTRGKTYLVDDAIKEAVEESEAQDMVVHPTHYTYGNREAIDYMRDMGILEQYCVGNVMKYIYRYKYKGDPQKDIEKAIMYLEILRSELDGR